MSEVETIESQDHEAANDLFVWFQGETGHRPNLTIQAKARLETVGVPAEHLERLRVVIANLPAAEQQPLFLYFSGFDPKILDAILGQEHNGVVEKSLRKLGLSTVTASDQRSPGAKVPEEPIDVAPVAKPPIRRYRNVGMGAVKKVTSTLTIHGEGEEPYEDDGLIEKNDTSLVVRSRPTDKDSFAADAVLGEQVLNSDNIKVYMQRIGQAALLSAAEEVELSKRIEAGLYAQYLLQTNTQSNKSTDDELMTLVREGAAAKAHMIEANLRLVVSLAKQRRGSGLDFLDLIQEGNLGLVHAVEKFDYKKGYKFSTYATWWIRQAIGRGIADTARSIRLPVHVENAVTRVRKTERQLTQQIGRVPSLEELAEETGMSMPALVDILHNSRSVISLDAPLNDKKGDPGDATIGDLVAAQPDTSGAIIHDLAASGMVDQLLGILDPRARDMIELRYGLKDGNAYKLGEVGEIWDITRERARQIIVRAEGRLKRHAAHLGLDLGDLFDESAG